MRSKNSVPKQIRLLILLLKLTPKLIKANLKKMKEDEEGKQTIKVDDAVAKYPEKYLPSLEVVLFLIHSKVEACFEN